MKKKIKKVNKKKIQSGIRRSQGQVRSGQVMVKVSRMVTNPLYGVRTCVRPCICMISFSLHDYGLVLVTLFYSLVMKAV